MTHEVELHPTGRPNLWPLKIDKHGRSSLQPGPQVGNDGVYVTERAWRVQLKIEDMKTSCVQQTE